MAVQDRTRLIARLININKKFINNKKFKEQKMAIKNSQDKMTLKEKSDFLIKLLLIAVLAYGVYSYNCNASKWMSKKCCKGKYSKSHSHYKNSSCSSSRSCCGFGTKKDK